ncbi:hypothetical protein pdam_00009023 [Pocillopora damicornis]|uniref:Uncharacterized protein n=1 Tax=Pocillopora damicornis TaxID=46731 RepID=A0A3M6T974_POCDA|nr:hypothetical protein pdam_00009023 [Pocillopora damicornis]
MSFGPPIQPANGSKRSAGIIFSTVKDQDKFLPPAGKRSAVITFATVKDRDKFLPPAGKRSAGVNVNTVEDQDKFLPPAGKRSADACRTSLESPCEVFNIFQIANFQDLKPFAELQLSNTETYIDNSDLKTLSSSRTAGT